MSPAPVKTVGDFVRDVRKLEAELDLTTDATAAAAVAARLGCGRASRDLLHFARAHLDLALHAAEPAPKEVA